MKKLNLDELNDLIDSRKAEVERKILRDKSEERLLRKRERDPDEIKILDELYIKRWKQAEQEGKVKYITKRKWYYEFD